MDILDLRPWPEKALGLLDGPRYRPVPLLQPLAALYGLGTRVHRWCAPRRELPSPPASVGVGNLRVGGTGKTPAVAECVRLLRKEGLRCGVLTRGYRALGGGDEPEWLQRETGAPVFQDPDRRRGFERARQEGLQVVVLDDAFQSRDQARVRLCVLLARDLANPPRRLPAGAAREGLGALERAHGLLVRREVGDPAPSSQQLPPTLRDRPFYCFRMCPTQLTDSQRNVVGLDGARGWGEGLLVSGLARPESLEADVRSSGMVLALSLRFSDHARFGERERRAITRALGERRAGWVLTTEKNLGRLELLELGVPVWALRSRLVWDGPDPGAWLAERVRQA